MNVPRPASGHRRNAPHIDCGPATDDRHPVMRRFIPLLLAIPLVGCGNGLAARQAYLNQFIGHPDSELVQRLGVPMRTYETKGVRYLAYNESRVQLIPSLPPYGSGPWWNRADGGGAPTQVVNLVCETTFAVADGNVKSYTLRGNACD